MNISMIADQQNCHLTKWEEILHFSLNEKSIIVCCWWPVEADATATARHTQLTNTFRTFIGEQIKMEEEIRLQNMQNIR